MMRLISLLCFFLVLNWLAAQNQVPEITNLQVSVSGSNELTVEYDLFDAEDDEVEITFRVSDDTGETFQVNTSAATGDLGFPVSPGTGKSIVWNFTDAIQMDGNYKVMLVADDMQVIDIQEVVNQVDSNRLRMDLELIEGVRHRTAGAVHLQAVKDLIAGHFENQGLETELMQFDWNGYTAENIIGWKKGLIEETETYIIDGHFDTVSESPGADDNGSAVAGVMEALRVLAPYQFEKSIKFVGFDLEEANLTGSIYYVNNGGIKSYETIAGVFNFEMIGYYDDAPGAQTLPAGFDILFPDAYNAVANDEFRGNFITNVGIYNHPGLKDAFDNAAAAYVPELRVISLVAPNGWIALTPDLGRSDHAPFWLEALPALMLTDGANFRNPNYHSSNDTIGSLNFTFMSNVVKATVGAVAELAGLSHSTFETADVELILNNGSIYGCAPMLYQNPNAGFVQVSFTDCNLEHARIQLFDVMGKAVYSHNDENPFGQWTIPTHHLPSGTYVLSIQMDQRFITEKLVINR